MKEITCCMEAIGKRKGDCATCQAGQSVANVRVTHDGGRTWVTEQRYRSSGSFEKFGYKFAATYNDDVSPAYWSVTELSTGMEVLIDAEHRMAPADALREGERKLGRIGEDRVREVIAMSLEKYGSVA